MPPLPPPQDPLAKLRPQLRGLQREVLLNTFLTEPFRIAFKGRQRLRWLLDHWGLYAAGSPTQGAVWIHAAAEGEMKVAVALIRALPETVPVVVTTNDRGTRLAREILGDRAELAAFPFPFAFAVRRFFRRYSPGQLIIIESADPRPLLYLHMAGRELPTALINGWISKAWVDGFLPLLDRVHLFGVRGEEHRDQLAQIGIPRERVHLTGEMKFDTTDDPLPEIEARVQELAGGRPILIAGSVDPIETSHVLDAFERLGGGARAMLIVAPRRSGHWALAERILRERRVDFVRRSRFPVSGRPAVLLLDQVGELAALYRLAAAAFVGESLTPRGAGKNPIEPARFAVPIAIGPNTENLRVYADLFERAGAWQRVADAEELFRAWAAWLDDPELARQMGRRAADLVEAQRGLAMARTLDILRPFLGLDDRAAV
jgi:3-deoxy-D-manno-octulosonic-acid transferase